VKNKKKPVKYAVPAIGGGILLMLLAAVFVIPNIILEFDGYPAQPFYDYIVLGLVGGIGYSLIVYGFTGKFPTW